MVKIKVCIKWMWWLFASFHFTLILAIFAKFMFLSALFFKSVIRHVWSIYKKFYIWMNLFDFFTVTWKVPSRKPNLMTIQTRRMPSPDLVKSTKLPSPCKTCGRPDLPERFHSHPATPLKLSPRKSQPVKETKAPGKWCFNSTTVKHSSKSAV